MLVWHAWWKTVKNLPEYQCCNCKTVATPHWGDLDNSAQYCDKIAAFCGGCGFYFWIDLSFPSETQMDLFDKETVYTHVF